MKTVNDLLRNLPGRIGDSGMALNEDSRIDPRIVEALKPFNLEGEAEPSPVSIGSPLGDRLKFCAEAEPGFEEMMAALMLDVSEPLGLENNTRTITGEDENEITLFIHRPRESANLPAILHLHGGGMSILHGGGPLYTRWRQGLAESGLIVVGVEFRNAAGALGTHAFPAGLNDCSSALKWMLANKEELGYTKLVVSGESGGGNLALALALKAKRDGFSHCIDGVYAQCPYISNDYETKSEGLLSLVENDTYFLNCQMLGVLASIYDGADSRNPLAWPYHATISDLEGLPPHVISVNELDPLRDEGLVYYRNLLSAGVNAASRTVNGTVHAGDVIFRKATPEICNSTIQDIRSFSRSL